MDLKTTVLLWAVLGTQGAQAEPTPAIQYVGAVSIQPSQDATIISDWYRRFGVDLKAYKDGGHYGMLQTPAGPFYFAVHSRKADSPSRSSGSVALVFRVTQYTDYIAMLEKRGLTPTSVDSDATGRFAHFRDPDGNEMTVWGE